MLKMEIFFLWAIILFASHAMADEINEFICNNTEDITAMNYIMKQLETMHSSIDEIKSLILQRQYMEKLPLETSNKTDIAKTKPENCIEATVNTHKPGIYEILVEEYRVTESFLVLCDAEQHGGGWLVIQSRQDGSEDFYRNWTSYKYGFGDLNGEFWIGFEKLHAITASKVQELLILMEDFRNVKKYIKYNAFSIGNEYEGYNLKTLGTNTGDVGDALQIHVGQQFSTKDKDNDKRVNENCAVKCHGAWWYRDCHTSNLNGRYLYKTSGTGFYDTGIEWRPFHAFQSLKSVKMMIRPQQ